MMPDQRRTISVIAVAYNEEACIRELTQRLSVVFDAEPAYDWETVIVENGSTDGTWAQLIDIHRADPRFRAVRLARNFRMDGGLTAGLAAINSDACILMAADLQDPPELIPEFIRHWEQGFSNVYGVVNEREGTGPLRSFNSRAFYWLVGKLTDGRIPSNASDFRLLDRRAYEAVRSLDERNRFMRGLVAWVGFESIGVPMHRPPRFAGESKAHTKVVIELALRGIFANSHMPLRLITISGISISALAFVGLAAGIMLWLTRGVPFGGFGTIVSLVLLLFGVLTFMIGILSEYVGLIYEEVKRRPNYIVRSVLGIRLN